MEQPANAGSRRTCLARLADGSLRVLDGDEVEEIDALRNVPDQVVWLDIRSPDDEDLALLDREFDVHELALEDLRTRRQRPKVDTYPGQHVVVTYEVRQAREDGLSFELAELHLFAGSGSLVSVHWADSPAVTEVANRFQQRPEMVAPSVGTLLYQVLDAVVDGYFPLLDRISDTIDKLESRVLEGKTAPAAIRELLVIKRELLELRRVLAPQRDIANALLRRELPIVDDAAVPYLQDLYDHLVRVLDAVDLYRDLVASALDANLAVTSNTLNAVMKRLTAFTVILMVPTLIAGIYGMNFRFMPELSSPWGYPFALGLMAVGIAVAAFVFRSRDWF